MPDKPLAVVGVLQRGDRFLVVRRGPAVPRSGYWAPPSGRVEPGESPPAALVREMREELGLTVEPVAKVWECDTDDGTFRLLWWTARVAGGDLAPDPAEVAEARWVRPEEFVQLTPTFADDRRFFSEVARTIGLVR
ncbi:MAG: NUDIX domain-containing protein [Micromonosporaceae bacterium]|jgi:8-oxo-dGTP diphosphatase